MVSNLVILLQILLFLIFYYMLKDFIRDSTYCKTYRLEAINMRSIFNSDIVDCVEASLRQCATNAAE